MYVFDKEIELSFTQEQREYILMLCDCARDEGATTKMLAPLLSLVWVDWSDLTEEQIKHGLELAEKYGWLKEESNE